MNPSMQVSVVIPVCNAADFVRQAVESALSQAQTAEIILVEDGSPDNSWEVCQKLASENEKIHLYRHPEGKNCGSGATRNEAIRKSTCEYIAFLDADDFYLPGRFATAERMFADDPNLEGVYEAIGMYVQDEAGLKRWKSANRPEKILDTMTKSILPEDLFAALVNGRAGSFSIDGMVVKRSVFEKSGYLDEDLRLHQDTAIILKMAAVARLMPGRLDEPVAMWRVHDHNRISAPRPIREIYRMKLKFWFAVWNWSRTHLGKVQQQLLLQAMINEARYRTRFNQPIPQKFKGFQKRIQLIIRVP
jgi:glycosyltransferase involved in cell wall biosynthesis